MPAAARRPVSAPAAEHIDVLYVAGSGRTGSTVLANILGQVDGFFAVGELWNLWRRGLIENRKCGCGPSLGQCPVWGRILRRAFGDFPEQPDARRLDELARKRLRAREIPAVVMAPRGPALHDDEYRTTLARLYPAIKEVTDCRVIVDSSKSPTYAALLSTIPGIRLHVVHLIRDPRAAAFSHGRVRPLPDFGDQRIMQREGPLTAARRWAKGHVITAGLLPGRVSGFVVVRYEDFVDQPNVTLDQILSMVDERAHAPTRRGRVVRLGPTHSVAGNPSRFHSGDVELYLDDEWRTAMPRRHRAAVTALTWPLLLRYGYPVWP